MNFTKILMILGMVLCLWVLLFIVFGITNWALKEDNAKAMVVSISVIFAMISTVVVLSCM